MNCVTCLLEDENIQNFLQENEDGVVGGAHAFHQFPQNVKDYVMENLDDFIADTLEETYENIVGFTETAAFQFLGDIVDALSEPTTA